MDNNKFDSLIPEMSNKLTNDFFKILSSYSYFNQDVDAAPFLNMVISVFISSLCNLLDNIRNYTKGEERLIKNIELTKESIIKSIEHLPFVTEISRVPSEDAIEEKTKWALEQE